MSLRRFLVEDSLVAVVSLPAGVFKPYSGVKTSILLLDKKLARRTDKILFLKIAADGFDLGDKRSPSDVNDLPEAERLMKAWFKGKLETDFVTTLAWKFVAKPEMLSQASVSLSAERYFDGIDPFETECPKVPLGELCEILDSQRKPITKSDREGGSIPYYGATGIVDYVAGHLFDEPLVLLGEDGAKWEPNEKSAFAIKGKTWVNNHAHVLRPDRSRILDTYLIETLNVMDLMPFVTGVTVPKLNQANLRQIEIPLPPLEEQRRIVAEIEGYQQVIDGARQILAAWSPRLTIDPDWPIVPLGEACEMKRGRFSHRPRNAPEFYGGQYPFIQTGDVVRSEGGPVSHTQTLNERGLSVSKLFQPPVVLVTIAANIGDTGLLIYPACFPDSVVGLTPKPGVLAKYLELAMRGKKAELDAMAPQMAQKNINIEILESVEIPLPPLPEQRRIVAELDAEAAEVAAVRALIPRTEAKIQRVLARVWGTAT